MTEHPPCAFCQAIEDREARDVRALDSHRPRLSIRLRANIRRFIKKGR